MKSTFWNVEDGVTGPLPDFFCGVDVPDGTTTPWSICPVGETYVYLDKTNDRQRRYVKVKNDGRNDDWVAGLCVLTKRVSVTDFTDGGSTSGTLALAELIPAGAWVQQTILQKVTGFAGDVSAVLVVGDGSDVDRYNTGTPSIFATAEAVDMGVPSGTKIHVTAATVTLTVTSNSDFTLVKTNGAGALTLRIYFLL